MIEVKNIFKPIVLIILDGWGIAPPSAGNAVTQAKIPNFKKFWNSFPHTQLRASEEAVGLPKGEEGNSEAGHLNLGAGTIVYQTLPQINLSIADGSFFVNPTLKAVKNHLEKNQSSLHLMGLIGSGGVHSNIEHLFALLRWAKEQSIGRVFLHLFTDGRDSPPTSCLEYLHLVEEKLKFYQLGKIATIMGRFYALDRDNRWERIKKAYEALTEGKGVFTSSYPQLIQNFYSQGITDEFLEPIIITENNQPVGLISENDAVIFFNFRIDRPRELTKAFVLPDFENLTFEEEAFDPYAELYQKEKNKKQTQTFKRQKKFQNLLFVTMTEYQPGLPVLTLFPPETVEMPLPRILAEKGWRQLHIAETEKARHVTYYFDGRRENPFPGEDWVVIPSPKVKTYDQMPEMSAYLITNEVCKRIKLKIYDFILINFANPDMVGHTGVLSAGIRACEVVDECLGKIVPLVYNLDGTCLITADHGNVEEMIDLKTGQPDTKHSVNPVPFICVGKQFIRQQPILNQGILADVAATVLNLAKINKPINLTGKSLI